jgi:hypothetical protein
MKEWKSVKAENDHAWNAQASIIFLEGHLHKVRCPVCSGAYLRFFFLRHYDEDGDPEVQGGSWIWCPACRTFDHGSSMVPSWWLDIPGVPIEDLEPEPDWLNTHWDQIQATVGDTRPHVEG